MVNSPFLHQNEGKIHTDADLGGRTAWSSTVTVQGQQISARFWYDGQYVDNAKEDAAEVALKHLTGTPTSPTHSRNAW